MAGTAMYCFCLLNRRMYRRDRRGAVKQRAPRCAYMANSHAVIDVCVCLCVVDECDADTQGL